MTVLEADRIAPAVLHDRRRPGRALVVHRSLLPLLRASERAQLPPLCETDTDAMMVSIAVSSGRDLDAGEGLMLGLGLGATLWAMMIAVGWAVVSQFG